MPQPDRLASAMAGRAMGRPDGPRGNRGVGRVQQRAAPLTLRANSLKTSRELLGERLLDAGIETEHLRFAPDGLRLLSGNPLRTPLAKQGLFVVQDEASQLVALMCGRRRDGGVSTPAPRRAARRSCSPPDPRAAASWSPRTAAGGGCSCCASTWPPQAPVSVVVALDLLGRRPIQGHLRPRARRRPVHGPGHAAARGRHPLAPLGA